MEEVLIHRAGSIRKLDGLLGHHGVDTTEIEGDSSGGLNFYFFKDQERLPFFARVLVSGDEAGEIREAVMKSLTYHLNFGG